MYKHTKAAILHTYASVLSTYMPEGTTRQSPLCTLNTEQYGYLHVTALHSKSSKTLLASDRHRALPNPLNPLCGLLSQGRFHAGQLHRIYSTSFGVSKLNFLSLPQAGTWYAGFKSENKMFCEICRYSAQ